MYRKSDTTLLLSIDNILLCFLIIPLHTKHTAQNTNTIPVPFVVFFLIDMFLLTFAAVFRVHIEWSLVLLFL